MKSSAITLDFYELLEIIGFGRLNTIIRKAFDIQNEQEVAIKISISNQETEAELQNEFNILKALDHPNICKAINFSKEAVLNDENQIEKSVAYLSEELILGGDLYSYIQIKGGFSEFICRFFFSQILEAIEYCHKNNIAHRDIKPENILIQDFWKIKLADFGYSTNISLNTWNGIRGTAEYLAPESSYGIEFLFSADLFSLGVVLFTMHCSIPPFAKADVNNMLYRLIAAGNERKEFWECHKKNKPLKTFSDDFQDLFYHMVCFDLEQRFSLFEIKNHPWMKGEMPQKEEVMDILSKSAKYLRRIKRKSSSH